jgi:hypothetical protein
LCRERSDSFSVGEVREGFFDTKLQQGFGGQREMDKERNGI